MSGTGGDMGAGREVTETDEVVITLMTLLIGSTVVAEPERRKGFDDALAYVRDEFKVGGKSKAAALTEVIRQRSTDERADPALLNQLLRPSQGRS